MQFKKILFVLLIVAITNYFCAKDRFEKENLDTTSTSEVNINIASEGKYPDADVVYLNGNLQSTTKDKAKYYLKKQLLGRQLVPNDAVTYDYWKDKQYFKNTPIINYIYNYHDVKDNKLYFSSNASELEGFTDYIFHGLAMWVQKNGKIKLHGGYYYGKLHGNFALGDESGNVVERFWYTHGKKGAVVLNKEDFYTPVFGKWEAELKNDGYYRNTQVYNLKPDGTLEFFQNSYVKVNNSWGLWTSETEPPTGLWKYIKNTDDTGTLEFYYNGLLAMKSNLKFLNKKEILLKSTYLDKQFDQKDLGKELRFRLP
ncbi:hypothetical protein ACFSPU_05190 [Haoranjiania flava]|uniref:Toxin-antitoxin system YwqK family antitoxin n=1 Tax=Haoranjiania flava TaxID=1856322 RepID=A0AAE3INV4_9BACT|nr:hypothetical protein [Haoranjiania flava]MCU7693721.1 hypothetical protein [Haoranjiania flava]